MKALFFTTYTPNNEAFWNSLVCCGVDVMQQRYDDRQYGDHNDFVNLSRAVSPDIIICVGALDWGPGISNPIPKPLILRQLRDVAPMVLLCGDVGDGAWASTLAEYEANECFTLIVGMDGVARPGIMSKLTPIDTRVYHPRPWRERSNLVGYTGGTGGEKYAVINALGATFPGDAVPYAQMADFMCNTKVIVNAPRTGSHDNDHVKGRVVEAGFAGACLLERRNAATAQWFTPNVDYLEYTDAADAVRMLQWIRDCDEAASVVAGNLHRKVHLNHHPRVFWRDVFRKTVGIEL